MSNKIKIWKEEWLITVEEIEIIVTAKVEEALKEFEKIVPNIKKQMKQVQEAFSKIETKEMQNKVQQATNYVKKKVQDLKQSSKNNEITIKVNNKDAQEQISQTSKKIKSLKKQTEQRRKIWWFYEWKRSRKTWRFCN